MGLTSPQTPAAIFDLHSPLKSSIWLEAECPLAPPARPQGRVWGDKRVLVINGAGLPA